MIGSLCSGYGGLDLAVSAHYGMPVAWHVEYDASPSKILTERFPGVPNHHDLTTVDWTQVEPVDILTAGYPCQPFSHAGKRKGASDVRHLWPYVAGAISGLRPRVVVLENVRGHVSLGLDAVLGDLAALGYDARWGVVRAADAGAPHGRARIFVVAHATSDGRHEGWTEPARVEGRPDAALRGDATPHADGTGSQGAQPAPRRDVSDGGTPAVTSDLGHEWARGSWDGWTRPTDSGVTSADTSSQRHGGGEDGRGVGRVDGEDALQARQRERARAVPVDRGAETPTNTDGPGRIERGGAVAAEAPNDPTKWGVYAPAIHRWEHVIGRPAPEPTEPGRTGRRLSPRFVEWLMGLDAGWVTDIDLTRSRQLKALGNGVVPQQALLALSLLDPARAVAA